MKQSIAPSITRSAAAAFFIVLGTGSAGAQVINDSGISYSPPADCLVGFDFGFDMANSFGRLAIASPGVNGGFLGHVLVYDSTIGALLHNLAAPVDASNPAGFGKQVVMEGTNIVVTTNDGVGIGGSNDQVFVYDAVTGELRFELEPINPLGDLAGYGYDIAIDNGVIAVSQSEYDVFTGCVYLFDATDGSQIDVIYGGPLLPSIQYPIFGYEIEMHNGLLTVLQREFSGFSDAQQIFIFDTSTRALLHEIQPPVGNQYADGWGTDLAMNDDTLIVCAPGDDPYGTNTGSVLAYDLTTGAFRNMIMVVNTEAASSIRMNAKINEDGLVAVSSSNGEFGNAGTATVKLFESHTGIQVGSLEPSSGLRSASFGLAMTFLNNEVYVSDIAAALSREDIVHHFNTGSTITMHPQSHVTDIEGFGPLMQVFATNATDYRWFKDGVEINNGPLYGGATTSVLAINAGPETEGAYTCEVTSVSTSSVMSEPGYLVYQGSSEPACRADFTEDGVLNFFDVSAFLQQFGNGCP